jgi:methionine-S-sulfoxide reductase
MGLVTWFVLTVGLSLPANSQVEIMENKESLETITLGAGCFWCVEAVFEQLDGVHSAVSGYMGGHIKNPGYREVCTGRTGHAEVVQVAYDASRIALSDLLAVFFATHDPTTLNRQGADVGTQYRSAIFYNSKDQQATAEAALQQAQGDYENRIVTEIAPASAFYEAEDYHQAYYELNGEAPYCRAVIAPKMQKFRKQFEPLLKAE